ncbi:hypothetical protein [Paenibacillus taiwanensis]|uniref:hypothetical protein n=1 Tax=Paenibacillus taiwanensis TaxID=401638 RepID=UPI0004255CC7|nr:hypothetical protein [Paenibacillus taiwanensis]
MNHSDANRLVIKAEKIVNTLDPSNEEIRTVMSEMINEIRLLEKQNEQLLKQLVAQQKNKMSSKLRDALYE